VCERASRGTRPKRVHENHATVDCVWLMATKISVKDNAIRCVASQALDAVGAIKVSHVEAVHSRVG
jgi:hypothetical protein